MTSQPSELDEIEARLREIPQVPIDGPCKCDGFSIGHERGCDRNQLGSKMQYDAALAEKIFDMAPALLDTIRSLREQVREAKVALEPFAMATTFTAPGTMGDDATVLRTEDLALGDFRRARTVHSKLGE